MTKLALLLSLIMMAHVFTVACSISNTGTDLSVNVGSDPDTIDPALNSAVSLAFDDAGGLQLRDVLRQTALGETQRLLDFSDIAVVHVDSAQNT